ncbi:hypothetical protein M0804_014568 [Polistes exclamans]|nr:hypothetical protein M0804_014573 [Polistes exclamans]KAI4474974.1 hypothetical protein M0804_014568 [Polistes exclamans]
MRLGKGVAKERDEKCDVIRERKKERKKPKTEGGSDGGGGGGGDAITATMYNELTQFSVPLFRRTSCDPVTKFNFPYRSL